MFDIGKELGIGSANDGERMEIMDIKGESFTEVIEDQPYFIVLGKDSINFRDANQKLLIESWKKQNKDENYKETPFESAQRTCTLLTACVVGLGNISEDGAVVECTEESVYKLLEENPSLLDQVDRFVINRDNFLKK